MLQKTFLFEDGKALLLIPKDQQIIPRMNVKFQEHTNAEPGFG